MKIFFKVILLLSLMLMKKNVAAALQEDPCGFDMLVTEKPDQKDVKFAESLKLIMERDIKLAGASLNVIDDSDWVGALKRMRDEIRCLVAENETLKVLLEQERSRVGEVVDVVAYPGGDGAGGQAGACAGGTDSRYKNRYKEIKSMWKMIMNPEENLFFATESDNSEITAYALQALMYRFLIDNPGVYIPDLDSLGVFAVAEYNSRTYKVVINEKEVSDKLFKQSIAAFNAGSSLYASVVQVGGMTTGHYILVVVEGNGKVHIVDLFQPYAGEPKNEEYQYTLSALVEFFNSKKSGITFSRGTNVRTGIQDANAVTNSCGLYSFAYWAALMVTQDMDSYQRVTASASDGKLARYEDIKTAASYGRKLTHITQILDREEQLVIDGIAENFKYYKNPHADIQSGFEQNLREMLKREFETLVSN